MGYISNNGTRETNYAQSIANRRAVPGANDNGAFWNRAETGSSYADFDQSVASINSYSQGSGAGSYTARAGETLSSVAASLWGDASLWYKLADANGLTGQVSLSEGQRLRIPAGVLKNTHNASTFSPYNPGEAIGDVNPTTPQPPKDGNKCGTVGQVVLVAIAVAVATIATAGAAGVFSGQGFSAALSAMTSSGGLGSLAGLNTAGLIGAGAVGGAAGSIASQGVGVATGIQDKFSWNAVALAGISGGVGAGLGGVESLQGIAGQTLRNTGKAFVRGAAGSAISQGIGLATGLQSKFDWAGVAGAAVGSAGSAPFGNQYVASAASAIANAATRSAIDGSSFGDNLRAAIPDVIGQALGGAVAGGVSQALVKRAENSSEGYEVRVAQAVTKAQIQEDSLNDAEHLFSETELGEPNAEGWIVYGRSQNPENGLTQKHYYNVKTGTYRVSLSEEPFESSHYNSGAAANNNEVSYPTLAEAFIPIYGSVRMAYADWQNGNYVMASVNAIFAISDVFLAKSIVTGIARGIMTSTRKAPVVLGLKRTGHSWTNMSAWMRKSGHIKPGHVGHHGIIPRNGWGKAVPNFIKNQPWNIRSLPPRLHVPIHNATRRFGPQFGMAERVLYGSPLWTFYAGASYGGRLITGGVDMIVDDSNKGDYLNE